MSVDTRLDGVLDREAFMALAAESVHLSPEDYLKIVDQAELVLRDLYVHLQQKQALYAVNPLDISIFTLT